MNPSTSNDTINMNFVLVLGRRPTPLSVTVSRRRNGEGSTVTRATLLRSVLENAQLVRENMQQNQQYDFELPAIPQSPKTISDRYCKIH